MASSYNILRASISGAALVGIEKVVLKGDGQLFSMQSGKKFAVQAVSSLGANTVKGYVVPYLPSTISGLSNDILTPLVVGATYTILTMLVRGIDGASAIKRFLVSGASEYVAATAQKMWPMAY